MSDEKVCDIYGFNGDFEFIIIKSINSDNKSWFTQRKSTNSKKNLKGQVETKEFCHNVTETYAYDFAAELLKGYIDG